MEWRVRQLDPSDLVAVEDLERRSFADRWPSAIFSAALADTTCICLGAEQGDALLGFIVVSQRVDVWDMLNIAVDPDHRRRGIAALLMRRFFEIAADDAPRACVAEVGASNTASRRLCERFGFETRDTLAAYYSDDEDALLMRKDA